jgi:hypothetical protein
MKALIIYDNFACAVKARSTLQRAAYRANAGAHSNIKPWRLDVLRVPSAADEALMEAADADLIVFAGPRAYSLPAWLEEWLECWVMRREVEDPALGAVRDGTGGELAALAAPRLSRFAERYGLSFIIENETAREDQAAPLPASARARKFFVRRGIDDLIQHDCRLGGRIGRSSTGMTVKRSSEWLGETWGRLSSGGSLWNESL